MTQRDKESYSSLSLLKQCPFQYKLKYVDKIFEQKPSIALDIGNLCHKVLEIQRNPQSKNVNYDELIDLLNKGYFSRKEQIIGLQEIKDTYYEDYILVNPKSNLSYIEKLNTFVDLIKNYKPEKDWEVIATELPFEIRIDDLTLIGKIDRIDKNSKGEYRVVDYKTSNMVYKDNDLTTPLQMYIYALAIKDKFGVYPKEFMYDFVLLGETRYAMTKGWKSRGKRALEVLANSRKDYYNSEIFPPKPTPLCWWCDYREKNCDYYSLWQPDNKTFEVNKKFVVGETAQTENNDWW